jgi:hypothetical protein
MAVPREAALPALRTPRAAGIAGIIFSVSMFTALGIIRFVALSHGSNPAVGLSSKSSRQAVQIALDLAPFAGIAFLWFLAVIRDHLGQREDKFFATVLFGSGLLFVTTLFGAAAVLEASFEALPGNSTGLQGRELFSFGFRLSSLLLNIFGVKMAAVFMFSTSTIALRTAFLPRWIALSGFACGVILLATITNWLWIQLIFPLWTLSVSLRVLTSDLSDRKAGLG